MPQTTPPNPVEHILMWAGMLGFSIFVWWEVIQMGTRTFHWFMR